MFCDVCKLKFEEKESCINRYCFDISCFDGREISEIMELVNCPVCGNEVSEQCVRIEKREGENGKKEKLE